MPIPHKPRRAGWFERDGNALLGEHYQTLVKEGRNPEAVAQQEGYKLQEIPGGVQVLQTKPGEGDEGA